VSVTLFRALLVTGGLQLEAHAQASAGPRYDARADSYVYVRYTDLAHTSLKPVARPTVHARRPSALWDLGLIPLAAFLTAAYTSMGNVSGIVRGEYYVVQSIVDYLMAQT